MVIFSIFVVTTVLIVIIIVIVMTVVILIAFDYCLRFCLFAVKWYVLFSRKRSSDRTRFTFIPATVAF